MHNSTIVCLELGDKINPRYRYSSSPTQNDKQLGSHYSCHSWAALFYHTRRCTLEHNKWPLWYSDIWLHALHGLQSLKEIKMLSENALGFDSNLIDFQKWEPWVLVDCMKPGVCNCCAVCWKYCSCCFSWYQCVLLLSIKKYVDDHCFAFITAFKLSLWSHWKG